MRVTIADYGVGNLHSIAKALATAQVEVNIEADVRRLAASDTLVLPGVGAFAPAAERIAPVRDALRERIAGGLPVLGICLGMQLLFERSEEGQGAGLGVIAGGVTRLRARRLPQLGWNGIEWRAATNLSSGLREAYYANTFVCRPAESDDIIAWSTHGSDRFAAVVRRGSCVGVQFHPEKSGAPGVGFIHAWVRSLPLSASQSSNGVAC